MSKKELLQKIKTLDNLSQQEKAYLVELINAKKYGLVWENKPETVEQLLKQQLPILKEVKEKQIIGSHKTLKNQILQNEIAFIDPLDNQNQPLPPLTQIPNHILIEGDNLHALTALSFTHENKIDVIYIDPPYNTGNKDFKYNDSFVDKEDTYRHSKWLSFMSKRLQIAKKLLNQNGVIFISIDDNEQSQLKLLCDEVFGEKNFVGQWNWFKSATPPNLSHKIKKNVEYILGYEKNRTNIKYKGIHKESDSDDPITKLQNTIKVLVFPPKTINFKVNNAGIKAGIYGTDKYPNKLLNDLIIEDFTNKNEVSFENRFVWTQPKLDEELENNTIINCSKTLVISYKKQNYSEEVPPNLIDESVGVETTEEAGKNLADIFGGKIFDYPKPVSLIKYILSFKENAIILDFFAGSGTTLHATMSLNSEDGGNRQCILVTNNENNICEEVTYERNKRVIAGYENAKGVFVEGLGGNNLRYYQCGFVSRSEDIKYKKELVLLATDMLCIKENCYELSVLSSPTDLLRVYVSAASQFLVIYDEDEISTSIGIIQALQAQKQNDNLINVYVFANGHYPFTEDFEEVSGFITLCALPDAIYKALQNVLPTKEDTSLSFEEETDENNGDLFSLL